jgi:predicted nucleic acid-binding protein
VSIYADSSFMVSLYLADSHAPEVLRRMARKPRIWLTPFHESEIIHAIAQQVFRGRISRSEADQMDRYFSADLDSGVWVVSAFPDAAFQRGIALARAHVARLGTRTLDSLHVACAMELGAQQFWTFEERQAKLAKAVGLKVL